MEISESSLLMTLGSIIAAASILLFVWTVLPVFNDGIPMNGDLPLHYGVAHCYATHYRFSWPSAWCNYSQAGIAPGQGYAPLHQHLFSALTLLFPLPLAFKTGITLIFLAVPLAGAILFLALGEPFIAAIAFSLLMVVSGDTNITGIAKIFDFGSLAHPLGSGLLILSFAAAVYTIQKPSTTSFLGLTIATAAFFLAHASLFAILPIILVVLGVLHRDYLRKHLKAILLWGLAAFLLIQYWFLPFIAKKSYFFSYTGAPFNPNILLSAPLWLYPLAGIGLCWTWNHEHKAFRLLGVYTATLAGIALLGWLVPSLPYWNILHGDRVLTEIITALYLLCAIAIGVSFLEALHKKTWQATLTLALVAVMTISLLGQNLSDLSAIRKDLHTSTSGPFPRALGTFKVFDDAQGRIALKDTRKTVEGPVGFSHIWAVAPAFSEKEFFGLDDNWYQTPDYTHFTDTHIFNKPLSNLSTHALSELFMMLNIEYIAGITSLLDPGGEGLPRLQFAYSPTNITPSYFFFPQGQVADTSYAGTLASARVNSKKEGELILKVRHFPNWKASVNGFPTPTRKGPYGLIAVDVPQGSHLVQFWYRTFDTIDLIGITLTLAGVGGLFFLYTRTPQ